MLSARGKKIKRDHGAVERKWNINRNGRQTCEIVHAKPTAHLSGGITEPERNQTLQRTHGDLSQSVVHQVSPEAAIACIYN